MHDENQLHRIKPSFEKSRELQRKLYLSAKRSRKRRFHALYDRIYRPDILWRAWCETKSNKGVSGLDGQSFEAIENYGVEKYLKELGRELEETVYRPSPVMRVEIPKPDGSKRPLGIPTIKDRIVQQACRIVIEPIFEANFQENSYGFRPRRSAIDAIKAVSKTMLMKWWVVDIDIKGYFDAIDHDILMTLVKKRISDRRVLKLLTMWLRSGVIVEGRFIPTQRGCPQGGVISPLLANIYLHVFDMYWNSQCSKLGKLIRYADDCVILCYRKSEACKILQLVEQFMRQLKLTLHPQKTQLVDLNIEGFDFLGYYFAKHCSKKTGKVRTYNWPSKRSMKSIRSKIRDATGRRMYRLTGEKMVSKLNPIIRGWKNYFKYGNSTKQFQELDRYVKYRLYRFLRGKKGNRGRLSWEKYQDWYTEHCNIEKCFTRGILVYTS